MRIFTLAIGALVLFGAAACGGGSYGSSSSAPLGTLDGFKAALEKKTQTTTTLTADQIAFYVRHRPEMAFVKSLAGTEFKDRGEYVVVFHDEGGKVKGLFASLRSQSAAFSTLGRPLEACPARLWLYNAGSEPTFELRYDDKMTDSQHRYADFRKGKMGGIWLKIAGSGKASDIASIVDSVWIWSP